MTTTEKLDKIHGLHKQVLGAIAQYNLECEAAIASQTDADEAYKKGLDEAWLAAQKIMNLPSGMLTECFSHERPFSVINKLNPSEALAKLRDYEARKKAEAEAVKVGDVVTWGDYPTNYVVTAIVPGKGCAVIAPGEAKWVNAKDLRQTPYSIPQIAEILDELKGEQS